MAQHDYGIANQSSALFRADINNALGAIVSNNSGPTAPSSTFANMLWYDTSTNILKMRNEADDTWLDVLYINQANSSADILNGTRVVNTSGTTEGSVRSLADSVWEAGTNITPSLVAPSQVKAAISAVKYESSYFSITDGASISLTHGLGAVPDMVSVELKCVVAEDNYSVGDIIEIAITTDSASAPEGVGIVKSATSLTVLVANNGPGEYVNKTDGTGEVLKSANWDMKVRAYLF